jgi:hypothetical protein
LTSGTDMHLDESVGLKRPVLSLFISPFAILMAALSDLLISTFTETPRGVPILVYVAATAIAVHIFHSNAEAKARLVLIGASAAALVLAAIAWLWLGSPTSLAPLGSLSEDVMKSVGIWTGSADSPLAFTIMVWFISFSLLTLVGWFLGSTSRRASRGEIVPLNYD